MRTEVLAGRYVLRAVLGTGGMATVWRATDEVLDREVAVKVLSPQFAADAGFMARFEREARHAARLSHPRLVTVFDCGVDRGVAFIVMELVAGHTLRQVLDDQGRLPLGEAVGIAAAVCEGLEVAHTAGLVHRDIKPANIVVSRGDVKVLDFGIARADGTAGGTRTMGVLGTAAYLSPEQASGGAAGPQSDLYSLGCVLFEMITGAPPFTADSAVGLAYRHVHEDPGPPSARRPGVPAELDWIIGRLLAKDPSARPPGAAAARAGLLAALNPGATAILNVPAEQTVSPGYRGRRRPTRAEIGLTAGLTAAVIALAAVLLNGGAGQPKPGGSLTNPAITHPSHTSSAGRSAAKRSHPRMTSALPPTAAALAALVGQLEAGVADGQVSPQAGQDLYDHLQDLLFGPPGRNPQQIQQQYAHLLQIYQQRVSQGQVAGQAATALRNALAAFGVALGAQ
jgi:serine/threonine-protein kinase